MPELIEKNATCHLISLFRTRVITPVDAELARGGSRSSEYRNGMLDAYAFRELRVAVPPLRYKLGTAPADAYFAGNERGHALWRRNQALKDVASTPSIHHQEQL